MLTVLVGSNTSLRGKRLATLLAPLAKEKADIRHYSDITFSADALTANAQSSSLFGDKIVSVISGIGDSAALRDELEGLLPMLAESEQQFFVSENSLPAAVVKKIKSLSASGGRSATLEEFDEKVIAKKKEAFNVFQLTDAFADRKRTACWSLYRAALRAGLEVRELHGKFFWAAKTLLLADNSATASEAGLHPFVFQKSKLAAKNFAPNELAKITHGLAVLFHDATFTGKDMELELEAFLLRVLEKKVSRP